MSGVHRLIVAWIAATTIHAPIPVFDGDDLKSGESPSSVAASVATMMDVDLVLLGCDPPDDSDDGPIDNDPEDGSTFAFGQIFVSSVTTAGVVNPHWQWRLMVDGECACRCPAECDAVPISHGRISCRFYSFGKLCQSGTTQLRC